MKGQVILKNLQWLGRHNPAFTPGSVQTAVAELLNPTSSILPYSARLCLNKPGMLCTGKVFFNIEAGKTKNIYFSTEVPTVEGTYPVYLDIFSNDQLLEAYRAAEDIIIGIAVEYTLEVTIEPPGAGYVTISPSKATYSAGEVITLTAHPHSGYEFDHWGGWPPYPGVGSTSPSIQITMDADWWVVAAFRKAAAPPPPTECTPGTIKCEGYDLYECTSKGEWMLVMKNSLQCGFVPPEKPPVPGGVIKCNHTFCLGGWFYACWPDGYGYPQFKAAWCVKDTPPIR